MSAVAQSIVVRPQCRQKSKDLTTLRSSTASLSTCAVTCGGPLCSGCCSLVAIADLLHVVASLSIRRHAFSELRHGTLAGVVTRKYEIDAIVEPVEQFSQVTRSARNVLCCVMRTPDAEAGRRSRHQLHQTPRAFRRDCTRVEVGFLFHHQENQVGINSILVSVLTDQRIET